MELNTATFGRALAATLSQSVDVLLATRQAWMEEDIRNGWRCFYALEIWLAEHLPAPLMNDNGRQYEIEKLRRRVMQAGEDPRFIPVPVALIEDYRNYLDTGPLGIHEPEGHPGPRDLVADRVTRELLQDEDRHFWFEVSRNRQRWSEEIDDRASHTPPRTPVQPDYDKEPARNPMLLHARDVRYWKAKYKLARRIVDWDVALKAKQLVVELMGHLAPEFRFREGINSKESLVFAREGNEACNWAILFDWIGWNIQGQLDFTPRLVLLDARALAHPDGVKTKIGSKDILFFDPFDSRLLDVYDPIDVELNLRFVLQRFTRAIPFYQQFVSVALQAAVR